MTVQTPNLVAKLRQSEAGRVFYNGQVHRYTLSKSPEWAEGYEFALILDDGSEVIVSDAYETMGFVYRAPDSGDQMTNMLVPLDDGEPDPVGIPDEKDLSQTCFPALQPIFESVQQGNTDPDDLNFCRQLFSSPEALLRTIQKEGDIDKARTAILRDFFRIT